MKRQTRRKRSIVVNANEFRLLRPDGTVAGRLQAVDDGIGIFLGSRNIPTVIVGTLDGGDGVLRVADLKGRMVVDVTSTGIYLSDSKGLSAVLSEACIALYDKRSPRSAVAAMTKGPRGGDVLVRKGSGVKSTVMSIRGD